MKLSKWMDLTITSEEYQKMLRTYPGALMNALDHLLYDSGTIEAESEYNCGHITLPIRCYIGYEFANQNKIPAFKEGHNRLSISLKRNFLLSINFKLINAIIPLYYCV